MTKIVKEITVVKDDNTRNDVKEITVRTDVRDMTKDHKAMIKTITTAIAKEAIVEIETLSSTKIMIIEGTDLIQEGDPHQEKEEIII